MDFLLDIVGESILLGLDSVFLGFCVKQIIKSRNILFNLQAAPSLSIDSKLENEVSKYPDAVIPYVVLRGAVKPLGTLIKSNHNNSATGVIKKLSIKEHFDAYTSAGYWFHEATTVNVVYDSIPFVITDGKTEIEVVDALSAKILDMDVVADSFEPIFPSMWDYIFGFFSGIRIPSSIRGIQTTEEMLRDGTYVTAVGELSKNGGLRLRIQPPMNGLPLYLTKTTKENLIKKLSSSKDLLRLLILIFGSVAILICGRIILKYLRKKKKKEREALLKQHLDEGRRERRSRARETNLSEALLCVVCKENPKEIILLPCGHVCLCEDCSDHIKNSCPICSNKITSKAAAFIS